MQQENLLQKSYDFISLNIEATSDKIPKLLRDFWLVPEDVSHYFKNFDAVENHPQFTIFMYALLKYKLSKGIDKFTLPPNELFSLFETWQILLSIAELNELTEVKSEPIKIFNFDDYDNLEIQFT